MNILPPRKALKKAYLKIKPHRDEIEDFKANLLYVLDHSNETEHEEFHKNLVRDFLKASYYKQDYFINTKDRKDLVIHEGKSDSSPVAVIIEAKRPTNKSEMTTKDDLNAKAMRELLLYYLDERVKHKNEHIKHLVITNIYEWFIFDAHVFDKHFFHSKTLLEDYKDFDLERMASKGTDYFYERIARPIIEKVKNDLEFTHFSLKDYEKPLRNNDPKDDNKLVALYKIFSPEHLLKLSFANDSNSLDKRFYSELLHLIGLKEVKQGSKKLIQRYPEGERHAGSLLENAIAKLDDRDHLSQVENLSSYGNTREEQLFGVGLELCITWINRILFLKLLEAQLLSYHKDDPAYKFLNIDRIPNYDELDNLFFAILAKNHEERSEKNKRDFSHIPYLNSSLFEPSILEHKTIFVTDLRDEQKLPIIGSTVLRNDKSKKLSGELNAIEYLFKFLDAYDFASEGSENIQKEHKTLINASVLGLIFEKINGYKDGSYFTPGFITEYMSRETIRRAVVQKFNEAKDWDCKNLTAVYNKGLDIEEANTIVNSLKICDPAVGSGHFLVSALNEILAIKHELKILCDRDGKRLFDYRVEVENDELVISHEHSG
ncbi:MAG: type II restriction endonuclease, partial [Candidatus Marinimicrobia bacterium]|nr:type II restriction endonuclease [Candidatus Neomarinimicrobiota bacterium]